jgi:DNA primase
LAKASALYADQFGKNARSESLASVRGYLKDHSVTFQMAQKYQLGYVADPLPGDERFRGALAIPYLSTKGVTALRFRLFGRASKIGQHKGQASRLYNTPAYFAAGETLGLAEGEIDALVATEVLGIPTLGVPGVENFKDFWLPGLKDFTSVFIFGDGDQAGRDFSEEMAERIGWRGRIIRLPDGEDISSLAAKGQLGGLRAQMTTDEDE